MPTSTVLSAVTGTSEPITSGSVAADAVPVDSVDLPTATTMTTAGPDATYPATTVVDLAAPVGPVPTGPVALDEHERCRFPDRIDFDQTNPQPGLDEATRLEPMIGVVLAYGGQHPAEFGGTGFLWLDAADGSVFAMFTDHVAEHRAALAAIVPHPDELYVCQSALSEASGRGLQALLLDEFNGRFVSLGVMNGTVGIGLRADQEGAAADLVARYGDAVIVRVGNLPYPLGADEESARVCDLDVTGPTEIDGVTATASLPDTLPGTGETVEGTVTIVNNGTADFGFNTGIAVGAIVEADTFRAVAVYGGGINSIGFGGTLRPGESREIPLLVSTASCDPDLGYTLPPGTYDLVVPVLVGYGDSAGDRPINELIIRARVEVG